MKARLTLLPALALAALAACSSSRPFEGVTGNLRVTGQIAEEPFSKHGTLSVRITDASTGYPLDVRDVEVKAGNLPVMHAKREQLGSYTADIGDADRIELLIAAGGRTATMWLRRQ